MTGTIAAIKTDYKNLQYQGAQAYMQGEFEQATLLYQKAFYQIRMLFRLPRVPHESIQYLVTACCDCVDFCRSDKPSWLYLKLAIKELSQVIKAEHYCTELRSSAMQTCVQMSSFLADQLESGEQPIEVLNTIDTVEKLWSQHSARLAVVH